MGSILLTFSASSVVHPVGVRLPGAQEQERRQKQRQACHRHRSLFFFSSSRLSLQKKVLLFPSLFLSVHFDRVSQSVRHAIPSLLLPLLSLPLFSVCLCALLSLFNPSSRPLRLLLLRPPSPRHPGGFDWLACRSGNGTKKRETHWRQDFLSVIF